MKRTFNEILQRKQTIIQLIITIIKYNLNINIKLLKYLNIKIQNYFSIKYYLIIITIDKIQVFHQTISFDYTIYIFSDVEDIALNSIIMIIIG